MALRLGVGVGIGLLILISTACGDMRGDLTPASSDAPTEGAAATTVSALLPSPEQDAALTARAVPKELDETAEAQYYEDLPLATEEPALATWETRESESPLATWDPSTDTLYPDAAAGPGTLAISDDCALLILPNQKVILPVWPELTAWNPATQTIEFVDVRGKRIELRDGDQISLGGYMGTWPRQFVQPPDPSCEADELFITNQVGVVPLSSTAVELPTNAKYQTPEEATAYATQVMRDYLQADNPHLMSIELLTLADALAKSQEDASEDPARAMEEYDPAQAGTPVWRVTFNGSVFEIPHCPPPLDPVTPRTSCGTGTRAIFTFQAIDGVAVSLAIPSADNE